jgi:acylphosphatase
LNRAGTLGLLGWGRNTEDGGVEVWFEGDSEKQDTFLQWLYAGPPFASVGAVEWTTPTFWRVRKFFYKITKQIPC